MIRKHTNKLNGSPNWTLAEVCLSVIGIYELFAASHE